MISLKEALDYMTFEKLDLVNFIQVCINSYKGKHRKVLPVLKNERTININDVDIVLGEYKGYNVICYRGTTGTAEWCLNMNAELMDAPFPNINRNIDAHLGFVFRFKAINLWLEKYVEDHKLDNILFLGHSLGATTAILSADHIKLKNKNKNIKVVTFGSPRVGNEYFQNFHEYLIPYTLNIRNKNDIVCRVPTEKMGYKHIQKYVWIKKPKWYNKLFHPIQFWKGCADDHRPTNYLSNLMSEKI